MAPKQKQKQKQKQKLKVKNKQVLTNIINISTRGGGRKKATVATPVQAPKPVLQQAFAPAPWQPHPFQNIPKYNPLGQIAYTNEQIEREARLRKLNEGVIPQNSSAQINAITAVAEPAPAPEPAPDIFEGGTADPEPEPITNEPNTYDYINTPVAVPATTSKNKGGRPKGAPTGTTSHEYIDKILEDNPELAPYTYKVNKYGNPAPKSKKELNQLVGLYKAGKPLPPIPDNEALRKYIANEFNITIPTPASPLTPTTPIYADDAVQDNDTIPTGTNTSNYFAETESSDYRSDDIFA